MGFKKKVHQNELSTISLGLLPGSEEHSNFIEVDILEVEAQLIFETFTAEALFINLVSHECLKKMNPIFRKFQERFHQTEMYYRMAASNKLTTRFSMMSERK
jgi:hypothetical protein